MHGSTRFEHPCDSDVEEKDGLERTKYRLNRERQLQSSVKSDVIASALGNFLVSEFEYLFDFLRQCAMRKLLLKRPTAHFTCLEAGLLPKRKSTAAWTPAFGEVTNAILSGK